MAKVLITGASGYLGSRLLDRLARKDKAKGVVAVDVRPVPLEERRPGVDYLTLDVRDPRLRSIVAERGVEVIVHLAAVVDPTLGMDRKLQYAVDVGGTENVLKACLASDVQRLIVTSSGAAYGYHADNPRWLNEDHELRGNPEFAYAHHKRLVEERLLRCRQEHPELGQVVFRPGTILGAGTRNQITALFDKRRLLGIRGGDDRFVFIWDEDVAACLETAIESRATGAFNLAGDGALSLEELAERMGKPLLRLPASLVATGLALGKPLGLTRYGPEQVRFLKYRPVLDNTRLKEVFGYVPEKTSSQTFEFYLKNRSSSF